MLNKIILGILKTMAKNPNIRQTEEWTESKMQMVSILTTKIRKVRIDHHFINVDVNDSHMEIHNWVSWFSTLYYHFNKIFSFLANMLSFVHFH